ncbi:MAG: class III poly(R)-hydroxyalkanoic acid synthase subunit PhaC [Gammaproteobacteria bacterium RIFCSPLOWO2_02_FULL_47_50]|nr:MAG: class III poly(R)-hydroxyalkanoic acid synthase subunit PhaC [Gammaproteobacteria bacterium RIFCSPLOWO2_02_47_7]OGT66587.1 MAG: class III poly(R)-hydroxyalkanoic acid synthase subunit PhaC [Gammaproteobacteria bacterium RIFCSPLOWO2_01_FULL_47_190]OGT72192.1 MAG: class III poly(R)-hydroxyalkanoic acid synthase subunit PhaC [Gammaproteobacteria bacterium RIFCSPLOWO2_12_47_11]OGT78556.1 MAG: class III poly(R)-hydroxyalkanoic acid synthase subunit PhaC [Gammaproteobacteria bacterium RIFCSPLO
MIPFQIRPDEILHEVNQFNAKLAQGINTLAEIGDIEVGVSRKTPVYQEDKMVLYRFEPRVKKTNPVPLLIVYALVNRPYMADLQDGRSMIQGLLNAGLDVYLIDWGYPDSADRYLTLDDYINGYIDRCVDLICKKHKLKKINILGICQGGTFSLCYTSLHPEKVRNLITTVTPVDFHTKDDLLSKMVRNVDIDLLVDTLGNIPGELLNMIYLSLKPFRLVGQKYMDLVNLLDDKEQAKNFMRMEKWIFDSPDQAGEAFREFTRQFYQDNGLVKGTVKIGNQIVDLGNITVPLLNIYAASDHLVPPDSSKALQGCVGSKDYTELEFPGGHIGIYVSNKAQKMIPPTVGKWLDKRT